MGVWEGRGDQPPSCPSKSERTTTMCEYCGGRGHDYTAHAEARAEVARYAANPAAFGVDVEPRHYED